MPVNASFVRDALGREIQKQVNLLGATVSTTYDPAGRVTSVNTDAPFAPSFSYQYNAVNNRVGAIESGGSNVSFAYDAIGQLVSEIRTGTNPYSISYSFDALGNRVSENNGGVTTTRTFNAANSMLTAVPSVGASTSRTYDANGNLTLSNTGGALTTLVWDTENKLLSCTQRSLAESYSYHASLNRIVIKSDFYRATLAGLRASKTSGGSTEPDVGAASCTSNHANPSMIWDEQNLAIATDAGFNIVERQSDAPAARLGAIEYSALILASYSTASSLLASGAAEDLAARYGLWLLTAIRPNGYIWGDLTYQEQDGSFVIPMFDAQGSNRMEPGLLELVRHLDPCCAAAVSYGLYVLTAIRPNGYIWFQGTSFWQNLMNYDAFGNMVSTPPAQPEPLQYVGQYGYYTDATGFVYVRNRYYDPVNGTWISRAGIEYQKAGEHPYGYAENDPVGLVDPTGFEPIPMNDVPNPVDPPPVFNPKYWNDRHRVRNNNCLCYSWCLNGTHEGGLNPGEMAGIPLTAMLDRFGNLSCIAILKLSKQDGLIAVPSSNKCPKHWHKVVVYLRDDSLDYHWYRQDKNGSWSTKAGQTPATDCFCTGDYPLVDRTGRPVIDPSNPRRPVYMPILDPVRKITNPDLDAKNRRYPTKCGALCAPDHWKKR